MKILNRFNGNVIFEFECETIKECLLKARERGANLRDIDLRGSNLCGSNLRDIDLWGANLCGADLRGSNLRDIDLRGSNLCGSNLWDADLWGANLCGANLWGANLRGSNLWGANLCGADLRGSNLCGANLYGANLCGANLWGATLWGEKLIKSPIYINAGLKWQIWITDKKIKIGCQIHTTTFWNEVSDEIISRMDSEALEFWNKWKKPILVMAKEHQKKDK